VGGIVGGRHPSPDGEFAPFPCFLFLFVFVNIETNRVGQHVWGPSTPGRDSSLQFSMLGNFRTSILSPGTFEGEIWLFRKKEREKRGKVKIHLLITFRDYSKAGYRMMTVTDPALNGRVSLRHAVVSQPPAYWDSYSSCKRNQSLCYPLPMHRRCSRCAWQFHIWT